MKKLLGLTLGVIMLSSVAMAQDIQATPSISVMNETVRLADGKHFTKEDKAQFEQRMKERKTEFANRLKLTEEQQKKADAIHEKSKSEMKPIMAEMKKLRQKADSIREQSKQEFEALLTPEQKQILSEMNEKRVDKIKIKKSGHPRFHRNGKGPRPMPVEQ